MKRNSYRVTGVALLVASGLLGFAPVHAARTSSGSSGPVDQVLEWNQVFIDTLVATSTANSSSQGLGAIVHTSIFDALNGIERRYTPIFVDRTGPARRVAPGSGHRCRTHCAGRVVSLEAAGAG